MSFGEAIRACLRKYAEFTGRARRSEFWWFFLFTLIVESVATSLVDQDFGNAVSLVFLLPVLAAASRRLHDTDHSAWSLLLVLIPIVGWIVLIVWLATEGTESHNRFGPPA
jgi:uncharacterized membrane protein YhaH (DUF805 family)